MVAGDIPRWMTNNARAHYIIAVCLSAPPWVDRQALYRLRDQARAMTELASEPFELDHIVPLNHPRVCGLTVPWNLQILPAKVNGAKRNNWQGDWDYQLELFA